MEFFFADDARQRSPYRKGMGSLVAIGGIKVPGEKVSELEREINTLCKEFGFPPGEMFKWSPDRNLWMHDNLVGERREEFFICVLTLAYDHKVKALAVIEDTTSLMATNAQSAEEDVTCLFLERVDRQLKNMNCEGIIIIDRPSGGRKDEDRFLEYCLETLQVGTKYVKPDRIALNIPLCAPSKFIRLLQVSDVVTSCTLAVVAGESRFSPPVFEFVKPLLFSEGDRIGGIGLKIHPDLKYANLYHWLLGDEYLIRFGTQVTRLPHSSRPYSFDPNEP